MKALIIGNGDVGSFTHAELSRRGWQCQFILEKGLTASTLKQIRWADIVAITMTTKAGGLEACQYALCALEMDKLVGIAEKAAMAYKFELFRRYLNRIAFNTTVGGESDILSLLYPKTPEDIGSILGIWNGTLNFMSSFVETTGRNAHEALAEARSPARKLVDSHSESLGTVVNVEVHDALMKAAIVFNLSGIGPIVSATDFSYWEVSDGAAKDLISRGGKTRFVVSINKAKPPQNVERTRVIPSNGFDLFVPPWHIVGTFVEGADRLFRNPLPEAESNRLVINNSLNVGWISKDGIGAGAKRTGIALANDIERLVNRHGLK